MLSRSQAADLAAVLDIDLDYPGMCSACLGIVAIALDFGDDREVRRALRQLTPWLWDDGLAEAALASVGRAHAQGLRHARPALAELEARGGRSRTARAIVLRLARELSRRVRAEIAVQDLARPRLRASRPELN